jgi:acyl-coenzyme A thioesterase PaaI-like protein
MPTGQARTAALMLDTRRRAHPNCVACGAAHPFGLRIRFEPTGDGSVTAEVPCRNVFEGYTGRLHGGVVSMLLDSAMTHCLFARGHTAVTGELTVRFRLPVLVNRPVVLRAWVERSFPPLHVAAAELRQDGVVKATARAKFMDQPPGNGD